MKTYQLIKTPDSTLKKKREQYHNKKAKTISITELKKLLRIKG